MSKSRDVIDVEPVVEAQAKTLFDRIGDYLTGKDWDFYSNVEKQFITFSLRLRDGTVRVMIEAVEVTNWSRILVYTTYQTFVPEQKRLVVSEALNRINYTSLFGNFELDMQDGEVRVRTFLEGDGYIGEPMIDRAVRRGLDMANQYQAALLSIAFGNAKAQDVLDMAAVDEGATLQ